MRGTPPQIGDGDVLYLYRALDVSDIVALVARSAPERQPRTRVRHYLTHKEVLIKSLLDDDHYWREELYKVANAKEEDRARLRREKARRHVNRGRAARQARAEMLVLEEEFLDLPSEGERLSCYAEAYHATSNAQLEHRTCAVCARSQLAVEADFSWMSVVDIPNRWKLAPHIASSGQILSHGCLLELKGCRGDGQEQSAEVCRKCLTELQRPRNQPPKHSLANNLWIGDIPWQLECLTFAEHLLIARVYPRVFVIKLFLRDRSRRNMPEDQVQTALRGNVTSFELNSPAIADMIAGKLMPQPSKVLASTLAITFIGRGKLQDLNRLSMLRVRRDAVANALHWLQRHNRKYYGDIIIDRARLDALPQDGVPDAIAAGIRQETDESVMNYEDPSHAPALGFGGDLDTDARSFVEDDEDGQGDADPDVIPLQALGVMDCDLSKVTASELMEWGLRNTQQRTSGSYDEFGYAVRYGAPVNTFGYPRQGEGPADPGRRNFWEAAFPLLYPYGMGGPESDRPVRLSLIDHTRWSLEYHDRRFRHHHSFMFTVFGIQQRRQGLWSAKLQMRRRDFEAIAHILGTIRPVDFLQAANEEKRGEQASSLAIRVLKRYITATWKRVMASGPSRTQLRSEIISAAMYFNQPTIWMTINPDDLHDPIPQIYAGEEIDMDRFIRTAGPDNMRRSQNIARDPCAAAKFFDFAVRLVLEKLFGITRSSTKIHTKKGFLGRVKAYFGTVECQGRGTLHLHMLVWLHNVPSPGRLKEMLQTSEFRAKVAAYLQANIRSFRPGLTSADKVKQMAICSDVAYSRPPDPSLPLQDFKARLEDLETEVVRAKQVHRCEFGKCLLLDAKRKVSCKRGAPWKLSAEDIVDQDGTYQTRRAYEFINGYCPAIAHVLRCNQDMQLLLHGDETLQIAHYISKYMTKAESRSHNVASLLADGLANHFSEDPANKDFLHRQKDLIWRAVNVLNREQEVSAPLVALHLMGNPDVYRSHNPERIFWGSFVSYIYRSFQELDAKTSTEQPDQANDARDEELQVIDSNNDLQRLTERSVTNEQSVQSANENETITLDFDPSGKIYKRSQVDDYMYRGTLASSYNVLDYFVSTYEESTGGDGLNESVRQDTAEQVDGLDTEQPLAVTRARGRPANVRIPYENEHPRSKTHVRVVRPANHNHAPNVIGLYFPRRNDTTKADLYAAYILVFLKPWRCPNDIKPVGQSWSDALSAFLDVAPNRVLDIIDNIEHKYEAQAAAENEQQQRSDAEAEAEAEAAELAEVHKDTMDIDQLGSELDTGDGTWAGNVVVTQEMLDRAEAEMENYREVVHGVEAVRIGLHNNIFGADQAPIKVCNDRATAGDAHMADVWNRLLKQKAKITYTDGCAETGGHALEGIGTVEPLGTDQSVTQRPNSRDGLLPAQEESGSVPAERLFPDQQRAFSILQWHLKQTINAEAHGTCKPPQLRLLMIGEGGTGKSRVIQTMTKEFERLGKEDWLVKAAFTGCAASHIEGQTTHSIARITVGRKNTTMSNVTKQEMIDAWKSVEYLIIDEYSMLSKVFLAQLSRHISMAKLGHCSDSSDLPFGGVNVILCGDGHQIPPIAAAADGALYHPTTSSRLRAVPEAGLGRRIYESFEHVVILKQQVRVTDPVWQAFLSNFRVGRVREDDVKLLDSVTLTNPDCRATDFTSDKWKGCILITPRNAVRMRWNEWSIEEHCRRTGHQMLIVDAMDTCRQQSGRRPITRYERLISMTSAANSRNRNKGKRERNGLPDRVHLAIGMKVMITLNINTDIDVTNGARGEIVGIKLHEEEPPLSPTEGKVMLSCLPAYILVKLDRTRVKALPGLEPGVIPITPVARDYSFTVPERQGNGRIELIKRHVRRLQFPVTPAYAFTDYRAQGQTLDCAVVDIAEPPTGGRLSQPNIYVALSRCSGLDNIRILRGFDRAILTRPVDIDLVKEDGRLEELNSATEGWWRTLSDVLSDIDLR